MIFFNINSILVKPNGPLVNNTLLSIVYESGYNLLGNFSDFSKLAPLWSFSKQTNHFLMSPDYRQLQRKDPVMKDIFL